MISFTFGMIGSAIITYIGGCSTFEFVVMSILLTWHFQWAIREDRKK
jgi:prepilin signal peptidase PulO-like enzyme (type II secretory pathway)